MGYTYTKHIERLEESHDKKKHKAGWFRDNFRTKRENNKWYCFGRCNGYDYSFDSSCEPWAILLAESYLRKYGHIE
jgi:hypothetical protein